MVNTLKETPTKTVTPVPGDSGLCLSAGCKRSADGFPSDACPFFLPSLPPDRFCLVLRIRAIQVLEAVE